MLILQTIDYIKRKSTTGKKKNIKNRKINDYEYAILRLTDEISPPDNEILKLDKDNIERKS